MSEECDPSSSFLGKQGRKRSRKWISNARGNKKGLLGFGGLGREEKVEKVVDDFDSASEGLDEGLERGGQSVDGSLGTPWVEKYSPKSLKEIAGNRKKIAEVGEWIAGVVKGVEGIPRCLILAGPPGTGKSTVVNLVAKEMDLELVEWVSPAGRSGGKVVESLVNFLSGVRYPSLVEGSKARIILVDDLPIIKSSQAREDIQKALLEAARYGEFPLVLIVSDVSVHRSRGFQVLGNRLLASCYTHHIRFNPVGGAGIKRALDHIVENESREVSWDTIDALAKSCRGDIRSAIMSLEMHCAGQRIDLTVKHSKHKKRKRKRAKKQVSTDFVGKDVSLETFHAVGKILNNKRLEGGMSKYNVEGILSDLVAEPSMFISFLHQNYADFFSDTNDISCALECLSEADILLPWRQQDTSRTLLSDCAASVACRSFMFYNRHPIQNQWRPIRAPETWSVESDSAEYLQRTRYTMYRQSCTDKDLRSKAYMSEYWPYMSLITSRRKKSVTFEDANPLSSKQPSNSRRTSDYLAGATDGSNAREKAMLDVNPEEIGELGIDITSLGETNEPELRDDMIIEWDSG